jgi:hypothetical protein
VKQSARLPARSTRSARIRATQRVRLGSAGVSRAGDGVPPSRTSLAPCRDRRSTFLGKSVSARRRNQHARRVRYPENKNIIGDFAYKFPPTPRVGLVWPRPHRPAHILHFAKKFFRAPHTRVRMRWTGQIFWLLAFGPAPAGHTFIPPSPPKVFGDWPWEVVSSYSSATAPDLHEISCADPLFQARKELPPEVAACAWRFKIYLINAQQISCALD